MNTEWENGIKPQFANDGRRWPIQPPLGSRKRDHDQYISPEINIYKQAFPFFPFFAYNYNLLVLPRLHANKAASNELVDVFKPVIDQIEQLVAIQVSEVKRRYKKYPKV